MRKLAPIAVAVAAALVLTAVSLAAPRGMGWSATLTAAQEVPKQVVKTPAAKGAFHATLSGKTLTWKLTFSKLSGPATAAHIHLGAMGSTRASGSAARTRARSAASGSIRSTRGSVDNGSTTSQ